MIPVRPWGADLSLNVNHRAIYTHPQPNVPLTSPLPPSSLGWGQRRGSLERPLRTHPSLGRYHLLSLKIKMKRKINK